MLQMPMSTLWKTFSPYIVMDISQESAWNASDHTLENLKFAVKKFVHSSYLFWMESQPIKTPNMAKLFVSCSLSFKNYTKNYVLRVTSLKSFYKLVLVTTYCRKEHTVCARNIMKKLSERRRSIGLNKICSNFCKFYDVRLAMDNLFFDWRLAIDDWFVNWRLAIDD